MRLLVFCGTRKAIERFSIERDWLIIVSIYPLAARQQTLKIFSERSDGKLAVDRSMLHGWRAPPNTVVLFDASWPFAPGSPESIQAAARVERLPDVPL